MEDEDDRPARPNGPGIWGLLTAIVAVLTLTLCGWYALIFVNPYSPLNPLPPATVTPYPVLAGPTPTLEPGVVAPTASGETPTPNPTAPQSAVATLTPSGGTVQPPATATTTILGQPTVTAGPSPTGGAGPTAEATRDGEAYPGTQPTEPSNYP